MGTAYAICVFELPSEQGNVLETEHFRVVEVYFSRDAAIEALDRLNVDHAGTPFCYVMQETNVVDVKPEPLGITTDPEFNLILEGSGDCRRDVILLVRQILGLPLTIARQMVDEGNAVVATGSHYDVHEAQRRFNALRAVTRIEPS